MNTLKLKSGQREFELEVNDWAARAGVSIVVRSGDSLVLTTLTLGQERKTADFVPLTVDYEEKYYAAGKIYGSRFVRREGRPSETAVLHGRLIDRSMRPALGNFTTEIQLINSVFSYDGENEPDVMTFLGSSLAIELAGIDWLGPVSCCRLKKINGKLQVNPKRVGNNDNGDDFSLLVAGGSARINMIEFEGSPSPTTEIVKGCELAQAELKSLTDALRQFARPFRQSILPTQSPATDLAAAEDFIQKEGFNLKQLLFGQQEKVEPLKSLFERLRERESELGEDWSKIHRGLSGLIKTVFKKTVLQEQIRPDGRSLTQVRPLQAQVGILPAAHGSALFARGLTHILSSITLAAPGEELWVKEIEFEGFKRVIHHYNFPPYSVGEVRRLGAPGRREIGHGALAEKALKRVVPAELDFPYTVRIVSDALTSNGSTSMGSVCAGSLALMDAGVPAQDHVAGISIGLVYENDKSYQLLTDIQGPEDHYGDMDFKIAETDSGVVAMQMDVKIEGLSIEMINQALTAGKAANAQVRDLMKQTLAAPRAEFKPSVPYVKVMNIDPEKIGLVIGTGGRTIQEITAETNTKIDIKPNGVVYISGESAASVTAASDRIKNITHEFQVGEQVEGKVVKILEYGALVELTPDKTALLHISQIADRKVERVEDDLKFNQRLPLVIKQIAPDGKISVSLKDARRS